MSSALAALGRAFTKVTRRVSDPPPLVPIVRLEGTLASGKRPGRLNIETVGPLLERAFRFKKAPAVVLVINSPGGSAVQSRLIMKRVRDLAARNDQKVLVFVEDVAASGGYFLACAGDEIIADPSSFVGSIGVIFAGFGFNRAIEKLGVDRRVYTAGKSKSTLDPFKPEKPQDVKRIKQIEAEIHQVFIDNVKARRGDRLKGSDDELFTGEFWSGLKALDLGLIDGLGDMHETLRIRFGDDVRLKPIAPKRPLFALPPLGLRSEGLAGDLVEALEDKALWTRFGR